MPRRVKSHTLFISYTAAHVQPVLLSHKHTPGGDWCACAAAELTGSFLLYSWSLQMLRQLLANEQIIGKYMEGPSQRFGEKIGIVSKWLWGGGGYQYTFCQHNLVSTRVTVLSTSISLPSAFLFISFPTFLSSVTCVMWRQDWWDYMSCFCQCSPGISTA